MKIVSHYPALVCEHLSGRPEFGVWQEPSTIEEPKTNEWNGFVSGMRNDRSGARAHIDKISLKVRLSFISIIWK